MSILSSRGAAGHPLTGLLVRIRARIAAWRQQRAQQADEQQTIALLQSLDQQLLKDIGAAAYLAERISPIGRAAPPTNIGRTEVGPTLAVYLPYWGRSTVNDARERR